MSYEKVKAKDAKLWKKFKKQKSKLLDLKLTNEFEGRMRENIAKKLKISPAKVGKMEYIDKHSIPEVKEAILGGVLSISTANEIAHLYISEQAEILDFSSVSIKELSQSDVAAKIVFKTSQKTDKRKIAKFVKEANAALGDKVEILVVYNNGITFEVQKIKGADVD